MSLNITQLIENRDGMPLVMGILNVTPDSFSDGGIYNSSDAALKQVELMLAEGADIIDIGGESTRPGAQKVSPEEEMERVVPLISRIKSRFDVPVSIDTYKEAVARAAVVDGGADIVNDISALGFSENMAETVAELKVPVILMHIKGTPETMQLNPSYENAVEEIIDYLKERADIALKAGISRNNIVVDPGIGFGKRLVDNIDIIKNLKEFGRLGYPVLMGLSRKRFLGELAGESSAQQRDYETVAADLVSFMNGASIIRVHNVAAAVKSLKVFKALL